MTDNKQNNSQPDSYPIVASYYANGYAVGLNPSDFQLIFSMNNRANLSVNMPHSVAKELALSLSEYINLIETGTNTTLISTDAIYQAIDDARSEQL